MKEERGKKKVYNYFMKTYRAILQETFEDDTSVQIHKENQSLDNVLELFEILDGKSFPILQIFISGSAYPHFSVIGGPDEFALSLNKGERTWQEYLDPDKDASNWKSFGLGYHNFELYENELCNKQIATKAILHFCSAGEWLINLPFRDKVILEKK